MAPDQLLDGQIITASSQHFLYTFPGEHVNTVMKIYNLTSDSTFGVDRLQENFADII